MRFIPTAASALVLATALAACGQAPSAVMTSAPVAPVAAHQAAAPIQAATAGVKPVTVATATREVVKSASLTEADAARLDAEDAANTTPNAAIDGAPAGVAETDVAEAVTVDPSALKLAAPRFSATEPTDGQSSAASDPWGNPFRPWDVGVVSKTHDTVTLAWRTDALSRGIVYFGKSWGLEKRGYEAVVHDNVWAAYHQVTVRGLSRFRSYTFTVAGIDAFNQGFAGVPVKTRTRLIF